MTFGVKFSASEVDDAFAEMKIDEVTCFIITNFITIHSDYKFTCISCFHNFSNLRA